MISNAMTFNIEAAAPYQCQTRVDPNSVVYWISETKSSMSG